MQFKRAIITMCRPERDGIELSRSEIRWNNPRSVRRMVYRWLSRE